MTDAFEREYLGVDEVVHSEKVAYRAAFVLLGGLSVFSAVFSAAGFYAAVSGELQGLAAGVFFALAAGTLAIASVAGSVLRTLVTESEVILHAGVRHEVRVPLAGVTGVTLSKYDAAARQRIHAEGRGAFVAIHPKKPSVCVEWVDTAGKGHVAYVASDAPEALANVIRASAARASAAAAGAKVRVATTESLTQDTVGPDEESALDADMERHEQAREHEREA